MGSVPLSVFTTNPDGISSILTSFSCRWKLAPCGEPLGSTARAFEWTLLAPRVSLDFWVSETIPDPFAWGFTDSFLSCALGDCQISGSQASQGEEPCVTYSQCSFVYHPLPLGGIHYPCTREWGHRRTKTRFPTLSQFTSRWEGLRNKW